MGAPGFDRAELPPAALELAGGALAALGTPAPKAAAATALGCLLAAGWKLTPPTAEEVAAIEAHDAALLAELDDAGFEP